MDEIRGRFPMPYDLFAIIVPGWTGGFFFLCVYYIALELIGVRVSFVRRHQIFSVEAQACSHFYYYAP